MATTTPAPEGTVSLVARFLRVHPEAYAGGVVAVAWLVLLGIYAQVSTRMSMSGMDMSTVHVDRWRAAVLELPGWELMVVAMMGASALPVLRLVSTNSLVWRRKRAMVEFGIAYLGMWAAFGFVAVAVLHPFVSDSAKAPLVVALAVAALWQLTPFKGDALRDCHRVVPLPPSGLDAEVAALRFGVRHASACIRSCWPVMLVMALLPMAQLWWMVGLTALVTSERFLDRPRRATRVASGALALAAIGMIVVAAL
jgi:predicted metal-binding membrane protein